MIQDKLTNDRGQVGIGTLIVFIALVLVAAIAAGVLINTAGFLQTQAEETGEDSTDQVADNVNVIGEVGDVAAFDSNDDNTLDSNYLTEVRLTVQRSAGSSEIDLSGLSIQWVGDNGFAQLIHASDTSAPTLNIDDGGQAGSDTELSIDTDESQIGTAGDATYLVDVVTADSSTDAVITDDGDRYEIVIPLASAFDGTNFLVVDGDLATINDPEDEAGGGSNPATDPLLGDIRDSYAGLDVEEGGSTAFDNTDLELLEEGQRAELEITTDTGATRNVVISAPDTFIGEVGSSVTL